MRRRPRLFNAVLFGNLPNAYILCQFTKRNGAGEHEIYTAAKMHTALPGRAEGMLLTAAALLVVAVAVSVALAVRYLVTRVRVRQPNCNGYTQLYN